MAIVHDYLNQRGGAERVVLEMAALWPTAPIYTSLYRPGSTFPEFARHRIETSFLDRLPVDEGFRRLFPLYPAAFRSLGAIDAELVISSSSGWAHSVHTDPGSFHVAYCHTPARWLWTDEYRGSPAGERLLRPLLGVARGWDRRAARRADLYIANGRIVQARIRGAYGREAPIVHPPVRVERFSPTPRGERLLVVSRLLAYKRIDLAVEAARRLGMGLDVVGTGPALGELRSRASSNVTFHGRVEDGVLDELLSGCRAFCFPGREDFGIAPVEAQAAGKPVIAYGAGGALETVEDGVTGVHFARQEVNDVVAAIRRCEALASTPAQIAARARRFSGEAFRQRLVEAIDAGRTG